MLAKCLIINVLRLIIVILFFIAFLNITYVARHSFATVLRRSGVNVGIISESLGHTDLKTTQIYLDSFENEQIDEAMSNLL
ncbi:tyrosine-type recombinase/integrase [Butyricimonas sp. Marseille-P3923]|uniref:tyrosine-type recombinase/integrase n=1 Tax=Butyricimonas sp. Marseille-P3923 TaxID=1987504 RepID=UPI00350E33BE